MDKFDMIEQAKQDALKGVSLSRDTLVQFLSWNPESQEVLVLRQAAREVAAKISRNRAFLWAAIGLDSKPCAMNCDFCSLGEAWGLIKEEVELTEEEILSYAREYVAGGVRWIVLRTTQFYGFERLLQVARKIRREVPGEYELGANIGEFDLAMATKMHEAGLEFVYHSVRLGEGKDTRFSVDERMKTLEAVKESALKLVYLVEPIGPEHSVDEIADAILLINDCDASVTGAMERVPVPGTPLGKFPGITEERLAQIVAVTRLGSGSAEDICAHQPSRLAMASGANVAVVERGAIPREGGMMSAKEWNGFDADMAKDWFSNQSYQV